MLKVPEAVVEHAGSGSSRRFLGGARVCYYQVRNAFVFAKRNKWRCGVVACARTAGGILRWHVTPRRLLHPTRLMALGLGVVSGMWLAVVTRPVPVPTSGMGPDDPGSSMGDGTPNEL